MSWSRRALARTASGALEEVVGCSASAMVPETSPAKKVMTSQSAIVARMVVEDRRLRVENRMATASHNEM